MADTCHANFGGQSNYQFDCSFDVVLIDPINLEFGETEVLVPRRAFDYPDTPETCTDASDYVDFLQ